jgi:hypothetical protein
MIRRGWWWVSVLMIAGALGGCADGDDDDDFHGSAGCVLIRELEPNDTALTADFLGDAFVGDCADVAGSLFDPVDVDTYRFLVQESLSLVVTLDHSLQGDFDVQLFDAETNQLILDCGSPVVPEGCVVPFVVHSRPITVDVVVTSVVGAGPYTLSLDAH